MRGNLGATSLRLKCRTENPMRDYDRLPAKLRAWLAAAALPWRPRSVRRAFDKALAETGDRALALSRLTALQDRLVAKDAAAVWGRSIRRCRMSRYRDRCPFPSLRPKCHNCGKQGSRVAFSHGKVAPHVMLSSSVGALRTGFGALGLRAPSRRDRPAPVRPADRRLFRPWRVAGGPLHVGRRRSGSCGSCRLPGMYHREEHGAGPSMSYPFGPCGRLEPSCCLARNAASCQPRPARITGPRPPAPPVDLTSPRSATRGPCPSACARTSDQSG